MKNPVTTLAFLSTLGWAVVGNVQWGRLDQIESDLINRFDQWREIPLRDALMTLLQIPELYHFHADQVISTHDPNHIQFLERPPNKKGKVEAIKRMMKGLRGETSRRWLTIIQKDAGDNFDQCTTRIKIVDQLSAYFEPGSNLDSLFSVAKNVAPFVKKINGIEFCVRVDAPCADASDAVVYTMMELSRSENPIGRMKKFLNRLIVHLAFTLAVFHFKLNVYHGSLSINNICVGETYFDSGSEIAIYQGRHTFLLNGYEDNFADGRGKWGKTSVFFANEHTPPEIRDCRGKAPCDDGPGTCCVGYEFDHFKREEMYVLGKILESIRDQVLKAIDDRWGLFSEWNQAIQRTTTRNVQQRSTSLELFMDLMARLIPDQTTHAAATKFFNVKT